VSVKKCLLSLAMTSVRPCEPIAWVWHEGNDPIGHGPIAVVDVMDVHLPRSTLSVRFTGTLT
jgi:hypothetical protein